MLDRAAGRAHSAAAIRRPAGSRCGKSLAAVGEQEGRQRAPRCSRAGCAARFGLRPPGRRGSAAAPTGRTAGAEAIHAGDRQAAAHARSAPSRARLARRCHRQQRGIVAAGRMAADEEPRRIAAVPAHGARPRRRASAQSSSPVGKDVLRREPVAGADEGDAARGERRRHEAPSIPCSRWSSRRHGRTASTSPTGCAARQTRRLW